MSNAITNCKNLPSCITQFKDASCDSNCSLFESDATIEINIGIDMASGPDMSAIAEFAKKENGTYGITMVSWSVNQTPHNKRL